MSDDRTRDRHEHSESWWDNRREKETQGEKREELQEDTQNRQEKNRIENHSLWEENRYQYSEFDEDDEWEYYSESCELAEYDRSSPDRLREYEIDRAALDLASNESSSEQ